eukprot:10525160-Lingulodinium_polyedra.AAC.1
MQRCFVRKCATGFPALARMPSVWATSHGNHASVPGSKRGSGVTRSMASSGATAFFGSSGEDSTSQAARSAPATGAASLAPLSCEELPDVQASQSFEAPVSCNTPAWPKLAELFAARPAGP